MINGSEKMTREEFLIVAGFSLSSGFKLNRFDGKHKDSIPQPTKEQLQYVKTHVENPVAMALRALHRGVKVLGIGEEHKDLGMELYENYVVDQAAIHGLIKYVALEINTQLQPAMDYFLATGERNADIKKILKDHNHGYLMLLNTLRKHRGKVETICVDEPIYFEQGAPVNLEEREPFMTGMILDKVKKDPGGKVIWIVGNDHLPRFPFDGPNQLAHLYKNYHSISQVSQFNPNVLWFAGQRIHLTSPSGIPSIINSPFVNSRASLENGINYLYKNYSDSVVIHPILSR